ncbi:MAG: hypothetical protein GEU90_20970, partial [Gemmatimonas sp.]|nr:hypothetical protein [Gemmatimonas sp.]
VFYNPAALARQRSVASGGVMALYSTSTFTFDDTGESFDSEQGTKFAPHAWLTGRLTPRIGAGIGFWAPYGLSSAWPLDFEGRYDGYDNTLRGIYVQPTIAVEPIAGRLGLGVGIAAVRGSAEIRRRLGLATTPIPGTNLQFSDLGVPDGTDFADVHLDLDDWSATFHVGLQLRLSERLSFGARYLHSAHLDLTGTADFAQIKTGFDLPAGNPFGLPPGTPIDSLLAPQFEPDSLLGDQRLTSELTLPNQLVAGVRFQATQATKVFFDYQWTGWSHFDEVVLDFSIAPTDTLLLSYRDASTLRVAVEFGPSEEIALRGGILYNTAAAPAVSVSPLLPEARRTLFSAGLGYQITERFSADAGLEVGLQKERRGRVRARIGRSQAVPNVGRYSAYGIFGGVTLTYLLGRER